MGLINHVFSADSLKKLYPSNLGIGHTRYSTSGISELQNCQPFVVETLHGKIAVAHNGELTNAAQLRRKVSTSFGAQALFLSECEAEMSNTVAVTFPSYQTFFGFLGL